MVTCTNTPAGPSMRPVTWMSEPPVPTSVAVRPSPVEARGGNDTHVTTGGVTKVGKELCGRRSEHEPALRPVAPRLRR